MRRAITLTLLVGLLAPGCTVTRYEKTTTVIRDGQGNIKESTEVEHIVQGGKRKKAPTRYIYEKNPASPAAP